MSPRQGPVFQGLPSPSLKKMRQMPREALQVHIRKLNEHAAIIRGKLERSKHLPQPPAPQKLKAAEKELHRLVALVEVGERILTDKESGQGYRGRQRS